MEGPHLNRLQLNGHVRQSKTKQDKRKLKPFFKYLFTIVQVSFLNIALKPLKADSQQYFMLLFI